MIDTLYFDVTNGILQRESSFPVEWLKPFFVSLIVLVLCQVANVDIYGVIVSSPKQFDLDSSKVKVTETAHLFLRHGHI